MIFFSTYSYSFSFSDHSYTYEAQKPQDNQLNTLIKTYEESITKKTSKINQNTKANQAPQDLTYYKKRGMITRQQ